MSTFTQENRLLSVSSPLGDDVLLLTAFNGREEMSRLFTYQLDVLSERSDLTAKDIVSKNVTWAVNHSGSDPRYFNGYVNRFSKAGRGLYDLHAYRLEVVPWLWFLTRTSDSRIFFPDVPEKNVKDVLQELFADYPFADANLDNLGGDYPEHEYWVQYRETAFNFASRLMEDAGIFYYWVHENGKHTMVLGDRKSHYRDCPEKFVPFAGGGSLANGQISRWQHDWECRSGQMAHSDYNFETPKTTLTTGTSTIIDLPDAKGFELYDYPGEYKAKDEGALRIKWRMEEEEAAFHVVRGESNCSTFFPGGKFTLTEHEVEDEQDKGYVLTQVDHHARDTTYGNNGDSSYHNTFTAIPDNVVSRPARTTVRPFVQGIQTAVVVGPPNEEIHTDQYGRIKVQFHWDRRGKRDEHSSCWIRVATLVGGKQWGMINIPRIGQEVVVEFLEGDPNRPLVIGSVYNANQMPPYGLPGSKRISGLKTHSSPGGGGYNELCCDDTKGKELFRCHAQKDMDTTVKNNKTELVENDRKRTVINNENVDIGVERTETVGANETITVGGSRTHTIKAACTETIYLAKMLSIGLGYEVNVGAMMNEIVIGAKLNEVGAYRSETVKGWKKENIGVSRTLTVGANNTINVTGKMTEDVKGDYDLKVGGALGETITGKHTIAANGNYDLSGPDIMIKGTEKITLTVGSSSIVIEPSKITIQATDVEVKSTGGTKVVADGSLKMSGGDYTLETTGEGVIKAGPTLKANATLVKINC